MLGPTGCILNIISMPGVDIRASMSTRILLHSIQLRLGDTLVLGARSSIFVNIATYRTSPMLHRNTWCVGAAFQFICDFYLWKGITYMGRGMEGTGLLSEINSTDLSILLSPS